MIELVSACGCSYTAASTAMRGRVTRSDAPRSIPSSATAAGMARMVAQIWKRSRLGRDDEPRGHVERRDLGHRLLGSRPRLLEAPQLRQDTGVEGACGLVVGGDGRVERAAELRVGLEE